MDELVVGLHCLFSITWFVADPKRGIVLRLLLGEMASSQVFNRMLLAAPNSCRPSDSAISEVVWVGWLVCLLACLFLFFVCAIQSSNRLNDSFNQWFQNVNGIHVVFLQPFYDSFMIWFANYQHWHGQGWLLATFRMFWVDADGQTPALTPTKMNSAHLPRNRNPKGNSSEPAIEF